MLDKNISLDENLSKQASKQRNGEIDILRFVFAMTIVLYHFSCFFDISLYRNGGVAVEFFFFLTGALMVTKKYDKCTELYKTIYSFIKKKIFSFYPYYISVILLQLVIIDIIINNTTFFDTVHKLVNGIPNLLLMQMLGIEISYGADIGGSWYLSAMIISVFILFCIYVHDSNAVYTIFPIIGLVGCGLHFFSGNIDFSSWGGYEVYFIRIIRALSGISLGAWAMGLSTFVSKSISHKKKIVLTVVKWLLIFVAVGQGSVIFENSTVISFSIIPIIILSFSGSTYIVKGNRLTNLLGKLSLVIYLTHFLIINLIIYLLPDVKGNVLYVFVAICPIFAYVFMIIVDFIQGIVKKMIKSKKF